jgi:hypothetical protein
MYLSAVVFSLFSLNQSYVENIVINSMQLTMSINCSKLEFIKIKDNEKKRKRVIVCKKECKQLLQTIIPNITNSLTFRKSKNTKIIT